MNRVSRFARFGSLMLGAFWGLASAMAFAQPAAANYQGPWWLHPPSHEPGGGSTLHQEDVIYATWFPYELLVARYGWL